MQKLNFNAINATRQRAAALSAAQRISEVARIANSLQQQGMSRTGALQLAERAVPHSTAVA